MIYYVYKITNIVNGKIYIGKHSHKNPYDNSYMGSGTAIRIAIKKYGLNNFVKEVLYCFNDEESAYSKEKELVTKEFINSSETYNQIVGGRGLSNPSDDIRKRLHKSPKNYRLWYKNLCIAMNKEETKRRLKRKKTTEEKLNISKALKNSIIFKSIFTKKYRDNMSATLKKSEKSLAHLNSGEFKKARLQYVRSDRHKSIISEVNRRDEKRVKQSESITGRKMMTDGNSRKLLKPEQFDEYLNYGWYFVKPDK